jgi:hypothetical protein
MFNLETSYDIVTFCKKLLAKRFPNSRVKQQINDSDSSKLNFACPYCGDSEKDSNKKRGHLYLTTNNYKCYNDGCSVLVPIEKFISNWALKYQLEIPTISKKSAEFTLNFPTKRKGSLIEFLISQKAGEKLLKFTEIVSRFSLVPCAQADVNSPVWKFIISRKIDHLPVFSKTCYFDSKQDKIYIFNLDLRSDLIIGFAIRMINDDWEGPRYNIKNYAELKKTGLVSNLDDQFIADINTLNNYFNILNVDFSKEVNVTEGQIDSMFIRNCIATTGVTKGKQLLDNLTVKSKTRILFDNDSAGRKEAISLLSKGYSVFLWISVISQLKKKYQLSVKELKSIKDINDLYKVMSNHDSDLTFDSFNNFLDQHFSKSALDIIFV